MSSATARRSERPGERIADIAPRAGFSAQPFTLETMSEPLTRRRLIERCLLSVPSLPMRRNRYSEPCVIGAQLPENERAFLDGLAEGRLASVFNHVECDEAAAAEVPALLGMAEAVGVDLLKKIQDAHDDATCRTRLDVEDRRSELTSELLALLDAEPVA